jgi:hypothetical protein
MSLSMISQFTNGTLSDTFIQHRPLKPNQALQRSRHGKSLQKISPKEIGRGGERAYNTRFIPAERKVVAPEDLPQG